MVDRTTKSFCFPAQSPKLSTRGVMGWSRGALGARTPGFCLQFWGGSGVKYKSRGIRSLEFHSQSLSPWASMGGEASLVEFWETLCNLGLARHR